MVWPTLGSRTAKEQNRTGVMTDTGGDWPLCFHLGADVAVFSRDAVPQVRRLAGDPSARAGHSTLGVSPVPDAAATASRLLPQADVVFNLRRPSVQVVLLLRLQSVFKYGVLCGYLSGARCRLAYGPADATATHCLLLQ